jgi:leader peptidase (prepilin peptidase) / N-methyltransferase
MLTRWVTLILQTPTATRTLEEITILIAWASSIAASLILLPNAYGVIGGGLAVLMIAIAIVDARRFIIPDELTAAALALGFLHAAIQDSDMVVEALASAALRGAVLAFAFLSLRVLYRRIRGREGIGLGDVKLAGVAGVWLDWWMVAVAIEVAALAALAIYAMRLLYGGGSIRSMTKLPFGLFFAPAIWLGWLLESTLFPIPSASLLQ